MSDTSDQKRKWRNQELIKDMKNGIDTARINLMESWFPNRPIIKKDKRALEMLKGKTRGK